ncbi:hypothetical protein EUZ85_01545 [Hahella sp. KA22]|uniref:hypothetical protein n=1 Tax=Hahella sp. KA22 TaxID=1628392 RepID=UPI000FDDE463|nr:hypothetical protein [Hahella sp. KA22]AZZ95179.1 hypothetical protein ENC22_29835 [Hahella sp. KA22]QAY52824.1 hypothetical protein EUZ85_01545 [Hahella sp. KA22]
MTKITTTPSRRNAVLITGGFALVLISAVVFWHGRYSSDDAIQQTPPAPISALTPAQQPTPAAQTATSTLDALAQRNLEEEELIGYLQRTFGAHIQHPKVQVQVLEKLMRFVQSRYPDNWREQLAILIGAAFPDLQDTLMQTFAALETYTEWMNTERYALMSLSDAEKRTRLWQKREALFGERAYEIWKDQWQAEQFQDRLADLEQSSAPVEEKIAQYKQQILASFPEKAEHLITNKKQELTDRFLSLSSVQKQLRAMPPEQRYSQLRHLRKELGMDEAALTRWEDLDKTRDARRANGDAYMTQRQALTEDPARIQALQRRYFGNEADIIAAEEASGYFRFESSQQYGIN